MAIVLRFEPINADCPILPYCVLRKALARARAAFINVLDDYTLADLVKPRRGCRPCSPLRVPSRREPSQRPERRDEEASAKASSDSQRMRSCAVHSWASVVGKHPPASHFGQMPRGTATMSNCRANTPARLTARSDRDDKSVAATICSSAGALRFGQTPLTRSEHGAIPSRQPVRARCASVP